MNHALYSGLSPFHARFSAFKPSNRNQSFRSLNNSLLSALVAVPLRKEKRAMAIRKTPWSTPRSEIREDEIVEIANATDNELLLQRILK